MRLLNVAFPPTSGTELPLITGLDLRLTGVNVTTLSSEVIGFPLLSSNATTKDLSGEPALPSFGPGGKNTSLPPVILNSPEAVVSPWVSLKVKLYCPGLLMVRLEKVA